LPISKVKKLTIQGEKAMGSSNSSEKGYVSIIEDQIRGAIEQVESIIARKTSVKNADELEAIEREIIKATDRLAGLMIAQKVQQALDSPEVQQESCELIDALPKKMKNQGQREIEIQTSRGEAVKVKASYYTQKSRKNNLKKRNGLYPGLFLLGIHDHCTPLLASEVSAMATILSSFQEARQVLEDRGLKIDIKTICTITHRYAQRAKIAQRDGDDSFHETVAGCRVVVSTDGGRVRIRKDKRGPKTKKGRTRYSGEWREPKLLIIYTVNEKGELDRTFTPFIDGTMKGPDAIFGLIEYYLKKLNIGKADKMLFIADGARWIWGRVTNLMKSLGLSPAQFYELVDYYHAVEHLAKVAELQNRWKPAEKKRWIKKNRSLLFEGKIDTIIKDIRQMCKGRGSKKLRTELNYFTKNSVRMCYEKISSLKLPIGSGAIESAVRRVVNLRLKGASIFWHEETVEAMLLLRSYYKAGRWNMVNKLSFSVHPELVI
jgi:hypothetical protein